MAADGCELVDRWRSAHGTYVCVLHSNSVRAFFARAPLGIRGDGLASDLVEQLLQQELGVVELGLYLLEHGEVLNDLFWKRIDGACEVCEGGEEARRAVGGFGRLLHPVCSETAGEATRIVVGRSDSGTTLPCRSSCACSGRHRGYGNPGLGATENELPQTRSTQSRVGVLGWRRQCNEYVHFKR